MRRSVDTADLASRLGTVDQPFVVDVREPAEFSDWSIPSAVNIPLNELSERLAEVPTEREVVTVCGSGSRSAAAADLLESAGRNVADLVGGMAAWGETYDSVTLRLGAVAIVQVRRRGKGCLSYLVGSGDTAFAVDPSLDTAVYRDLAADHGWTITRVFDTHLHADHLSGARVLSAETGGSLHLNPADTFDFSYQALVDGDRYELPGGTGFAVAAMTAPGHTGGSTVFVVGDEAVLSGDTLFVEGVGRPDLADRAEEFARNLYRSLRDKVLALPDAMVVLPAHYGEGVLVVPAQPVCARLGDLRSALAPLAFDEDEFVAWATEQSTPRPPNYAEIVEVNMGRASMAADQLRQLERGPNRCSVSR